MLNVLDAVLVGAGAALGLLMLYAVAEHNWPDNYFSVGASVDPLVSRKLTKYATFRLGPVYVAAAFSAVTADRLHGPAWLAAFSMAVVHVSHTSGRAMFRIVRHRALRRRLTAFTFHAVLVLAIFLVTVLGVATLVLWGPLVPRPSELSIAVWAGLSAAVLAVWVRRLTFRPSDLPELVNQVRDEVGLDLLLLTREQARSLDADPYLAEALLLAEALNRPKWLRRLEERKGRFIQSGSYGVMQAQAERRLSDEESISCALQPFAGARIPLDDYGFPNRSVLHALVERHNPDLTFVELVEQIINMIRPSPGRSTKARASDGRPVIEVQQIFRLGEELIVSGTADVYERNLLYCWRVGPEYTPWASKQLEPEFGSGRASFSVTVPVATLFISLQGELMGEEQNPDDRKLQLDCRRPDQEAAARG